MNLRKLFSAKGALRAMFVVACALLIQSAVQAQTLTPAANPPSGLAGVNQSYLTGSGFPAGTITGATVTFAATCGGTAVATGPVTSVAVEGPIRRFGFLIPKSLATGTYDVSVAGTAGSTAFNTLNTPSCSTLSVTATSTTLAACVPTSSLAVTAGTNVNAFVPFGYWEGGETGIEEVPIEGTGTAANFPTTGVVNSCASDSVTGEVVCTENNTNVDLISSGGAFSTLTSGSNTYHEFSGGECENCGVAVNAANDYAVIAMGLTGSGSSYPYFGTTGVQVLNLGSNTFNAAFPLANIVSEDISIDSSRSLVLSAGEGGIYDLLKIGAGNTFTEYGNSIGGELDSSAEDCTTGIG